MDFIALINFIWSKYFNTFINSHLSAGGYVVIVMRQAYLQEVKEYRGRLERRMAALEKDQRWKMVERTVVPKYSFENDGVVFVFQVTQNNGC